MFSDLKVTKLFFSIFSEKRNSFGFYVYHGGRSSRGHDHWLTCGQWAMGGSSLPWGKVHFADSSCSGNGFKGHSLERLRYYWDRLDIISDCIQLRHLYSDEGFWWTNAVLVDTQNLPHMQVPLLSRPATYSSRVVYLFLWFLLALHTWGVSDFTWEIPELKPTIGEPVRRLEKWVSGRR